MTTRSEERMILIVAFTAVAIGVLGMAAVILFRQPGPFPRPFVMPQATTTTTTIPTTTLGAWPKGLPG